jgi:hypothetical protein
MLRTLKRIQVEQVNRTVLRITANGGEFTASIHRLQIQVIDCDRTAVDVVITDGGKLSVNHQAHVGCPILQPPGHRCEPFSERVMLLGGGTVVHNAHGQWHDVGIESAQFGQQ